MRFRAKILLVVLLAAVPPAVLLGWMSYRANREELTKESDRRQLEAARSLSEASADLVFDTVEGLKLAATYLPLSSLTPEQVEAAQAIPFRQLPRLDVLAVVDDQGLTVAAPMRAADAAAGRTPVSAEWAAALPSRVPLKLARETGAAVGVPYARPSSPAVGVAVRADERHLLVAELSLWALQQRAQQLEAGGAWTVLLGPRGEPLFRTGADARVDVTKLRAPGAAAVALQTGERGEEHVVAVSPVSELGWSIAVGRPASDAFAPAERVRTYTLFWVGVAVLAALVLGTLLAREVTRPVSSLATAVSGIAAGRYDSTARVEGQDELAQLAGAFNHMAKEIRVRDEEIRGHAAQLERRVEEKTRELKDAQEQVERSRRMAALGSFSAGFAHELNNPLTSVIGIGSMLGVELAGSPSSEMLQLLLREARRMAKIVDALKRSVDDELDAAGTPVSMQHAVLGALESTRPLLDSNRIRVEMKLPEAPLHVLGSADALQHMVEHLVKNAITAMKASGGKLGLSLQRAGDAVRLEVSDTGRGIAPDIRERIFDPFFTTKDDPQSIGMGLTTVHRTVEAHHGRVRFDSEVGRGTTFSVILPAAQTAAHLE